MSDDAADISNPVPKPVGGRSHAEAKAARLKAALRDNLRRRKASGAAAEAHKSPNDYEKGGDHEKATPSES